MNEAIAKAKAYSQKKHSLIILQVIIFLAFFILIEISGLSSYLSDIVSRIGNRYFSFIIYIGIVWILLDIIDFPIHLISSYVIEQNFGLSKQTFISWLWDYFKELSIGGLMSLIMAMILYYFLRTFAESWWLYTAIIFFLFNIFLAKVFPIFIIPLFYKLHQVEELSLKSRLISLAQRAGIKVLSVYNIALGEKTNKANAALCGWGATKRILVSDTLLEKYSDDEIESTLAHEIAHYKFYHFWKLSLFNFIFVLIGFFICNLFLQLLLDNRYIKNIYDLRAFPIMAILFILYSIAIVPLFNFISRIYETQADREAVHLTNKPLVFAKLIERLTLQNLSDPEPSYFIKLFFYDHPPSAQRIQHCQRMATSTV